MAAEENTGGVAYGATARLLHWVMAVLIVLQVTAGLIMVYAPEGSLLASLTDTLGIYGGHKLLGLTLLALVLVRITWRIAHGAPAEEPTLAVWQRETSSLVHAWLYLALIVVPLLGWAGVSLYPALEVGWIKIPGLLPPDPTPDKARATAVFAAHAIAAIVLVGLIAMHVGAALYHYIIRGDGVLQRMLPGLARRR